MSMEPNSYDPRGSEIQPTAGSRGGRSGCGICCGVAAVSAVGLVVLLVFGFVFAMAASGLVDVPVLSRWLYKEPARPSVASDPNLGRQLEARIEAALAKEGVFTLEMTDAEINSLLATNTEGLPLEDAWVEFQPGEIILTGRLTDPIRTYVTLRSAVRVSDGQLEMVIREAKLGALSLPPSALEGLGLGLNQELQDAILDSGFVIREVKIEKGRIKLVALPPE